MSEVDPVTELPADSDDRCFRDARRTFYESVLSIVPTRTRDDLSNLCKAWREFWGAEWVWLWLFHPGKTSDEGHWELTSVEADGAIARYVPELLEPKEGTKSVAEFCNVVAEPSSGKLGRPVLVRDIKNWRRVFQGKEYRVVSVADLLKMGCASFVCIPLIPPGGGKSADLPPSSMFRDRLRAAICAHFATPPTAAVEGERSLNLMGRLSAHFLSSSYEAAEHRILTQMNLLAESYLTRKTKGRRLEEDRRAYLNEVIALVKQHLSVQYASIFYRNHANSGVVCLATTGLHESSGKRLPDSELSTATYSRNESLTGRVFSTGEPYFSRLAETPERVHGKYREQPDNTSEADLAWIAYPILAPVALDRADAKSAVLGVIRCVGNLAEFVPERKRNIDPLQVKTLDFVAKMLAPVLETMAANIERERVISIIKHDLFSPLKMMEDSLAQAASLLAVQKLPNDYFVPDMQFSITTAKHLVSGLDQNPTLLREYNPKPTYLEGDIVAGIRSMLSHYARIQNEMELRFRTGEIKSVFPRLNLDRALISRAFSNLIVNAIKYGRPGTTIYVDARDDVQGYYLEVSNYGIGVLQEERTRIFEEGYRSPRAITKAIGLGMGLPIAKAIMEKHGGTLLLSSLSEPTTFSMLFPAHLRI